MTTINMTPTARDIADAALALQYDDITSHAELIDFANALPNSNPDLRLALIDSIDLDLSDMIHNANLDFYAPLDDLDRLSNSQFDSLANYLDEHIDAAMIADALLDKYPAI